MLLLSVSCSQNDPENAMVFHAIQQPRPRYVKLGACRSMDASAFENRSEALAVVFPCARWFRVASSCSQFAISPRFSIGVCVAGEKKVRSPFRHFGTCEQGTEVRSRCGLRSPGGQCEHASVPCSPRSRTLFLRLAILNTYVHIRLVNK